MIKVERGPINFWTVGSIVIGVVVQAFIAGGIWASLNYSIVDVKDSVARETQARIERSGQIDDNLKNIQSQLPTIQQLQWNVNQLVQQAADARDANKQTNERISRYIEANTAKLDGIQASLNTVSTQVAVILSRVGPEKPQKFGGLP